MPHYRLHQTRRSTKGLITQHTHKATQVHPKRGQKQLPSNRKRPPSGPRMTREARRPPPGQRTTNSDPTIKTVSYSEEPVFIKDPRGATFCSRGSRSGQGKTATPITTHTYQSQPVKPSSPRHAHCPPDHHRHHNFTTERGPLGPPEIRKLGSRGRIDGSYDEGTQRITHITTIQLQPSPINQTPPITHNQHTTPHTHHHQPLKHSMNKKSRHHHTHQNNPQRRNTSNRNTTCSQT